MASLIIAQLLYYNARISIWRKQVVTFNRSGASSRQFELMPRDSTYYVVTELALKTQNIIV